MGGWRDPAIAGAGADFVAGAGDPDDAIRFWIEGEAHPRVVIGATGVLLGDGTAAPVPALGGSTITLPYDDTVTATQLLYGSGTKTGLAAGNGEAPVRLEAGLRTLIDDALHDYNVGLFVRNWTADGAGIVVSSPGSGDALYGQASSTAHAQALHPYALNIEAGTVALQTADSGTATATDAFTLTDTTKTWTPNAWAGRWVVTPDVTNPATAVRAFILENTVHQLLHAGWEASTGPSGVSQQAAATPGATTAYAIPKTNATAVHAKRYSTGHGLHIEGATGSGANGVDDDLVLFDLNTDAGSSAKIAVFAKAGATQAYVNNNGEIRGRTFSFISGVLVVTGTGSPEGVLVAPVGSTYHRTDGGAGTSLYVKESGAGNTGWIAK